MIQPPRLGGVTGGPALGIVLALALSMAAHSTAWAQDGPNEVTVTVEPIAGGAQYLRDVGRSVQIGAVVSAGPVYGAWFDNPGIREWATAYPVFAVRAGPDVRILLSPIGAAVVTGNDFGSAYPSAQGGLELTSGRLRVASSIRVIRIAGGNGSGDYRARWIPIRVGYAFRW